MKKLQLKKNVIANIGKPELDRFAGGQQTAIGGCYQSACPVSITCILQCTPTLRDCFYIQMSDACDSVHLCNNGQLQTVEAPCHY